MLVNHERIQTLKSILFYLGLFCVLLFGTFQDIVYALDFTLYGHSSVVWDLKIDNDKLYSVGADGTLKVWNKELLPLQSITTHGSWARCVAVNDKYVAVGGYKPDNTIKVYDKHTMKLLHTLKGHAGSVFSLNFHNTMLISAGSDNTIIIWKDFKLFKSLKIHDGWIRKIIVFGNYLISGDENGRIAFSSLEDFNLKQSFEFGSQVLSLHAFKNVLYSGFSDGSMYRFRIEKNTIRAEKVLSFQSAVQSIVDDGKFLYVSVGSKVIVISDERNVLKTVKDLDISVSEITALQITDNMIFASNREGEILKYSTDGKYIKKAPKHFLSSAKIHANKDTLVVGREDGTIESYNVFSGLMRWNYKNDGSLRCILALNESVIVGDALGKLIVLRNGKVEASFSNEDAIISCTPDSSGKNVIYLGSRGKILALENIKGKWALRTISKISEEWSTSIHDDGEILYFGTNIGNVYMLDKKNYQAKLIKFYPSAVVKIARTGNHIFVFYFDGTYALFDGKSWNFQKSDVFPLYTGLVGDSQMYLGGSKLKIGNEALEFEAFVVDLANLPGTRHSFFASLSNGVVLQIENGNVVRRFSGQLGAISTIYANGVVACGHEDGKVTLWTYNVKQNTFQLTMVLDDHIDLVKSVASYKNYVISASNDRTIKIWDFKTGKLVNMLIGHSGYVWSILVVGDILVSGGWDGKVILWDLKTFQKLKTYEFPKLSFTDIFALSEEEIYLTTLEGFVVRIYKGQTKKVKISEQTLWSIDSNYVGNLASSKVRIYTAGWDGRVYILDKELKKIGEFRCHNSTIFKVIHFDQKLFTAGTDNLIKVWDLTGDEPKNIGVYSKFRQSILSVALSKTLGKLITTDGENLISVDLGDIPK